MFSNETVTHAIQYTESFLSNDFAIKPNCSNLNNVVDAITFPMTSVKGVHTSGDLETITKFLTSDQATQESEQIDKVANELAQTILNNIKLTQEAAIPLLKRTSHLVDDRLDGLNESFKQSLSLSIQPNPVYELIAHDAVIDDIIKSASNTTFDNYKEGFKIFPKSSFEEIKQLCHTGSTGFDELLVNALHHVGEHRVEALFTHYLSTERPHDFNFIKYNATEDDLVLALMGYALMTNQHEDNIPENIDLPLEQFKIKCVEFRAVCRHTLSKFVANYRLKESINSLVFDTYKDKDGQECLNIIPSVYEKAQQAGITVDVLIGSTLVNDGDWHLPSLLKNKDAYQQAFVRHNEEMHANVVNSRSEVVIGALNTALKQLQEANPNVNVTVNHAELSEKLTNRLKLHKDQDTMEVLTGVVLTTLFAGTMVPQLVGLLNMFGQENPDARPEDLAAKAVLRLLVDHLVSSVDIVAARG